MLEVIQVHERTSTSVTSTEHQMLQGTLCFAYSQDPTVGVRLAGLSLLSECIDSACLWDSTFGVQTAAVG